MTARLNLRYLLGVHLLCSALLTVQVGFAQDLSSNAADGRTNPSTSQGLLSRLRSTNSKTFNLPWVNRSSETRSSLQEPIDLPSTLPPSSLQQGRQVQAIGSGVARRSVPNTTRSNQRSPGETQAPAIQTPPLELDRSPETKLSEAASEPSNRKELRVYEAAPSLGSVDAKNTSRRKSSNALVNPAPGPRSSAASTLSPTRDVSDHLELKQTQGNSNESDLPSDSVPSVSPPKIPAINTSARPSQRKVDRSSAALDVRVPQLRLRVDGPQAIEVGQKTTYTIHATNEGENELQGLIIRASTPKGVVIDGIKTMVGAYELDQTSEDSGVLWEIESLAANDSKSMEMQIEVLEAEEFALNLEWTVAPSPSKMNVQVNQPKLEFDLSGPADVEAGLPQKYRMRVKNSGTADLPELNLLLQTETTSQFESQIGPLAAGAEKIVDVELTFDQVGLFPIVATAKDPSGKLQQRQRIDVQVDQVELEATWLGPQEFIQGSQADYELRIDNLGGIAATNLECSVEIPSGVQVLELPRGITQNGNVIQWSIRSLAPNDRFSLALPCQLVQEGKQSLVFHARSKGNRDLQANITTLVDTVADLELSVKEPQAPATVGSAVVYEIQIANRGSKAAEKVRVLAQFSEGIEPLRIEGHAGRIIPGQALFEELPQIAPNQTIVLKVICQASSSGVHRFRAAVQSPSSQEDLLEEGSTRFVGGSLKR